MAKLLKGKEVIDSLNEELRSRAAVLRQKGIEPTLGIVRLGEHPDDLAYEHGALKRAENTGVSVKQFVFDQDMSQDELLKEIDHINVDDSIHGVLIFRPLPPQIDEEIVRNALAPEKDVDGITDISMAGVYAGADMGFPPCTAEACMQILDHYNIDVESKDVAVIGCSLVVGRPLAMMLIERFATVTLCHIKTVGLADICKNNDIIISAAGHMYTVTDDSVTPGQTIIDVAINFDDEGNMCGDVEFDATENIVDAITPVPGGVGTVTTSMLMKHVIAAAEKK